MRCIDPQTYIYLSTLVTIYRYSDGVEERSRSRTREIGQAEAEAEPLPGVFSLAGGKQAGQRAVSSPGTWPATGGRQGPEGHSGVAQPRA